MIIIKDENDWKSLQATLLAAKQECEQTRPNLSQIRSHVISCMALIAYITDQQND